MMFYLMALFSLLTSLSFCRWGLVTFEKKEDAVECFEDADNIAIEREPVFLTWLPPTSMFIAPSSFGEKLRYYPAEQRETRHLSTEAMQQQNTKLLRSRNIEPNHQLRDQNYGIESNVINPVTEGTKRMENLGYRDNRSDGRGEDNWYRHANDNTRETERNRDLASKTNYYDRADLYTEYERSEQKRGVDRVREDRDHSARPSVIDVDGKRSRYSLERERIRSGLETDSSRNSVDNEGRYRSHFDEGRDVGFARNSEDYVARDGKYDGRVEKSIEPNPASLKPRKETHIASKYDSGSPVLSKPDQQNRKEESRSSKIMQIPERREQKEYTDRIQERPSSKERGRKYEKKGGDPGNDSKYDNEERQLNRNSQRADIFKVAKLGENQKDVKDRNIASPDMANRLNNLSDSADAVDNRYSNNKIQENAIKGSRSYSEEKVVTDRQVSAKREENREPGFTGIRAEGYSNRKNSDRRSEQGDDKIKNRDELSSMDRDGNYAIRDNDRRKSDEESKFVKAQERRSREEVEKRDRIDPAKRRKNSSWEESREIAEIDGASKKQDAYRREDFGPSRKSHWWNKPEAVNAFSNQSRDTSLQLSRDFDSSFQRQDNYSNNSQNYERNETRSNLQARYGSDLQAKYGSDSQARYDSDSQARYGSESSFDAFEEHSRGEVVSGFRGSNVQNVDLRARSNEHESEYLRKKPNENYPKEYLTRKMQAQSPEKFNRETDRDKRHYGDVRTRESGSANYTQGQDLGHNKNSNHQASYSTRVVVDQNQSKEDKRRLEKEERHRLQELYQNERRDGISSNQLGILISPHEERNIIAENNSNTRNQNEKSQGYYEPPSYRNDKNRKFSDPANYPRPDTNIQQNSNTDNQMNLIAKVPKTNMDTQLNPVAQNRKSHADDLLSLIAKSPRVAVANQLNPIARIPGPSSDSFNPSLSTSKNPQESREMKSGNSMWKVKENEESKKGNLRKVHTNKRKEIAASKEVPSSIELPSKKEIPANKELHSNLKKKTPVTNSPDANQNSKDVAQSLSNSDSSPVIDIIGDDELVDGSPILRRLQ